MQSAKSAVTVGDILTNVRDRLTIVEDVLRRVGITQTVCFAKQALFLMISPMFPNARTKFSGPQTIVFVPGTLVSASRTITGYTPTIVRNKQTIVRKTQTIAKETQTIFCSDH